MSNPNLSQESTPVGGQAISDLPLEVVLHLIQASSLSHEDVLNLALTSQHFHRFLIPYLLGVFGVRGSPVERASLQLNRYSSRVVSGDCQIRTGTSNAYGVEPSCSPDSLTIVNVAFQLSTIPKLNCTLQGSHFRPIVHQINRLKETICGFSHVDEVELIFGQASYHYCVTGKESTPDDEVKVWTDSFGGLLNTIVEKGATKLAVRGGIVLTRVYWDRLPPIILEHRSISQRISALVHDTLEQVTKGRNFNIFNRDPIRQVIVPVFPDTVQQSQITTFEITSPIMFTTPFSQWSFSLVRSSPRLTTLVLSDLVLSGDTWGHYLSFLQDCLSTAGCNLTSFSLLRCLAFPAPTVFSFLRHLQSLTAVLLDCSHATLPGWSPSASEGMPAPFLPRLKTLQGSLTCISHFLQIPTLQPSSDTIENPHSFRLPSSTPSVCAKPLLHVDEVRICFTAIPTTFDQDDGLTTSLSQLKEKCNNITIIFDTHWSWNQTDNKYTFSSSPHEAWAHVTGMVIPLKFFGFLDRFPSSNEPRSALVNPPIWVRQSSKDTELYFQQQTCRFINQFLGVKRISIIEYPARDAHGALPMKPPTEDEVRYLVTELWRQCNRVESIEIIGVEYSRCID